MSMTKGILDMILWSSGEIESLHLVVLTVSTTMSRPSAGLTNQEYVVGGGLQ